MAGMTDEETERTAELFLSLEGAHSLVVVEHDMKFIGELTTQGANAARKRSPCCTKGWCWQRARWPKRRPMTRLWKSIWGAEHADSCSPAVNQYYGARTSCAAWILKPKSAR